MVKSLHRGRDSRNGNSHEDRLTSLGRSPRPVQIEECANHFSNSEGNSNHVSQGTMSVASYYIKLKALWDEIELYRSSIVCNKTNEHQIEKEEDKLMQFLMGLNDSFKTIRSNILIMNPLPNV